MLIKKMISLFVSITIAIVVVLIISGLEFTADYLITKNNNITYTLVFGIFLYLVIGIIWGLLIFYRNNFQYNLSVINALWQVLSILLIFILSKYILKEKTNNVIIIGLVISVIGIIISGIGNYQITT